MATVLKRPMFKLGGPSSDGVGILSGMKRTGYSSGSTPVDPTELQPQIPEWWDLLEGQGDKVEDIEVIESQTGNSSGFFNEELAELYKKLKDPEKATYGWNELIKDAYRTSKGAATGKDWLTNAADLALSRDDQKKAEKKAKNAMLYEAALKGGKAETDFLRATTDPQTQARMSLLQDVMVKMDTWRKENPGKGINDWLKSGNTIEIDASMRNANPSWPGITSILLRVEDMVKDFDAGAYDDDSLTLPKEDWEIEAFRDQQIQRLIGAYLGFTGNAMGGKPIRRGYNMGMGPVMDQDVSMTENIQTPGGDMSMTENVDTFNMGQQGGMPSQTMPSDDPFVLLRARLPEEITDDVVRLIAYNPEAFTDFADIETQEDVIAFNKKYGVELVINTDEMSGAIA